MIKKRKNRVLNNKSKNEEIKVINYFPPQLWSRKKNLEKLLKIARSENPELRTQIRMGDEDITLYTKMVGQPFYQWTPITKYGDPNMEIPDINMTTSTRKRKEITPDKNMDKKRNTNNSPVMKANPGNHKSSSATVTNC